jgi:hypothetical protein
MKEETLKKYIGKTFGVITVIDVAYETYDKAKQSKRTYFNVHCNRCGRDSILRADALIVKGKNGKQERKSCKLCYADLQKEIADNKYAETRHFRQRLGSIKGNAKGRGFDFYLTEDEVKDIIEKPCFYCGKEHSDGIDPSLKYIFMMIYNYINGIDFSIDGDLLIRYFSRPSLWKFRYHLIVIYILKKKYETIFA